MIKIQIKKRRGNKGFSLPSVIIGTIISAILTTAGVSSIMGALSGSKETTIASHITAQQKTIIANAMDTFIRLEDANDPLNGGDANTNDYLADGITAGFFDDIPKGVFDDPTVLTWEIRKVVSGGRRAYYIYISSTNAGDQELIQGALNNTTHGPSTVLTTP